VCSHVERGGVRSCSWSLACQVRRNLGASRWHDRTGIRKSEDKMDLRRSRSLGLTHGFPLPSLSTFNTLYVDYSLVLGLAVFFYVSCHPLRHSHSHSRIQSPILFSFLTHGRHSPSGYASLLTSGGRRLTTLLSRYVLEPIPPSCARAFTALLLLF